MPSSAASIPDFGSSFLGWDTGFGLNVSTFLVCFMPSTGCGFLVGLIPWLVQFILYYQNTVLLLNRISSMFFNYQSPTLLIILSLLLISLLTILISTSFYYIKTIIYDRRKN